MPRGVARVDPAVKEAVTRRRAGATGAQVVDLARQYTMRAIRKLVDLMDGKGGTINVLDKEGNLVTVDVEVPATVQAKCAEIILERGYGKSPQAILLKNDSPLQLGAGEDARDLTVEEKIQRLLQAKIVGAVTVDLEASQQSEPLMLDVATNDPEKRAEPVTADEEILDLI